MSQTENKTTLKFILRFALCNCIWIIPVIAFCLHGAVLTTIFYSFLLSYAFLSWLQYFDKKPIILQKTSWLIKLLYYIAISIFLVLTGFATYEGIVNVFGLVSNWHIAFAIVFAIGIPLALFVITLFIKERKSPSLIIGALVLYVLFDSLTALPFNFLFFYEHLKTASNVEFDKRNITVVIDACDSVITPKYTAAVNKLTNISSKMRNAATESIENTSKRLEFDKEQLKSQLNEGTITKEKYDENFNWLRHKYKPKEIKKSEKDNNAFNTCYADSISTGNLLAELSKCKSMKLNLDNTSNVDSATRLSNLIKVHLIPICNASNDTTLKSYVALLYPNKPSSLESIKQLYRFIGYRIIGQDETKIIENNNNGYDKDSEMLLMMSLSSSIVIDILPLLLSLLYAKFKRDD